MNTIEPTETTADSAADNTPTAPAVPSAAPFTPAAPTPAASATPFAAAVAALAAAIPASTTIPASTAVPAPTIAYAASALANADALAAQLAEAPPHSGALADLSSDRLSATGRIDAVLAWERLVRHAYAGLIRSLGPLAREAMHSDGWLVETELCAALAWSPATTQFRLDEAGALTRLFPQTLDLLSEGRVSTEQARALAQLTAALEDDAARAVQDRVLARMPGQSAAATRQAIRRAVVRADPEAAAKRHQRERARRRVELRPEDDGMATLSFYLPADIAQMAMRTLTEMAQRAKRQNKRQNKSKGSNSSTNNSDCDNRTLDQRRADLLPALLSRAPGTDGASPLVPARVNVVVGIETLLGLSHEPGHLDGYGPICPEQTRRIAHAHAARWRFLLTASDGTLVEASERTYTPRAAIKQLTQLKFTTCAFPNCAMPADRCDLDHNQAHHKGGPTSAANLAPLCRRHHNGKSFGHWDLRRNDGDRIEWTSKRTGRSYTTGPTRYPLAA